MMTFAASRRETQARLGGGKAMITYKTANVRGRKHFYREAGTPGAPDDRCCCTGSSSSHMFRDLIPMLADKFHLVAPDYVGFGYSDMPSVAEFDYTFDNLAAHVEELLLGTLGLKRFCIYVQDYGARLDFVSRRRTHRPLQASSLKTETLRRRDWPGLRRGQANVGRTATPIPKRRCERC